MMGCVQGRYGYGLYPGEGSAGADRCCLMIDNYDSFTFNLVQYFGELGAEVRVVRNDEIELDAVARLAPDHLVISPGPCTPNEAGISVPLIRRFAGQVPILGVCLGHQIDRSGVRRQDRPCAPGDAWQGVADHARQRRRVQRPT